MSGITTSNSGVSGERSTSITVEYYDGYAHDSNWAKVRRGDAALESQAGLAWPAQPRGSAQTAHRDAGERSQNPSIAALFAVFKVLGCVLGVF